MKQKLKTHGKKRSEEYNPIRLRSLFSIVIILLATVLLSANNVRPKSLNQVQLNLKKVNNKSENLPMLWNISDKPEIFPTPKYVEYYDNYYPLFNKNAVPIIYLVASAEDTKKASAVFNSQLERIGHQPIPVVSDLEKVPASCQLAIVFKINTEMMNSHDGQAYKLNPQIWNKRRIIEAVGTGQTGCIYAATALGQLISIHKGNVVLREAKVEDWPEYKRRIFNSDPVASQVPDVLDWMLRYRMECLRLSPDVTPWWEVSQHLEGSLAVINQWKEKYGGVHVMLALHIYEGRDIVFSNSADREALKKVIGTAIQNGVDRIMIQADDHTPYEYGEGYVLTDEEDKKQFNNLGEAHCFLMQDLNQYIETLDVQCELYYCPPSYTYEIGIGDMNLYKGTPWEKAAYDPFKRELQYIGKNMPENVFVIWTGPNVRSRWITDNDLQDWKNNLAGRTPFLWDNTMYGHHPFTTTALFTAYDNELPSNFHQEAGSGMYLNGDAYGEINRAAYMTANDFLWEGYKTYVPDQSLSKAIASLYGADAVENVLELKKSELALRQIIGKIKLKDDIDLLSSGISKMRSTTGKNPFYYHQIYLRLLALKNQLKFSLSYPNEIDTSEKNINELNANREECLKLLRSKGLDRLVDELESEMDIMNKKNGI